MIYLLHSTVPVGGTGTHSARHYMGYADDRTWRKRIDAHRTGRSNVAIVRAYLAQGGRLLLVAVLPGGTRTDERHLKDMGHMARLCPICNDKREVGWPNGLIALIPRRRALTKLSPPQQTASGGAWPALSSTPATTPVGPYPVGPFPDAFTLSGDNTLERTPGGKRWRATVPGANASPTGSAGTRLPSSFEESASLEPPSDET